MKLDEVESGRIDVYKEISGAAGQKLGVFEKFLLSLLWIVWRHLSAGGKWRPCPLPHPRSLRAPVPGPAEEAEAAREAVRRFGGKR